MRLCRQLQCNPRERRAIVCENLLSPSIVRESIAHVLLEKYQVIAVTFVYIPMVSLVPLLQHTTALVVDLGFSETRVLPVYAGVGVTDAMTSSQICTRTLYARLRQELNPKITSSHEPTTLSTSTQNYLTDNILEDILVRVCFVAPENDPRNVTDVMYPTPLLLFVLFCFFCLFVCLFVF